MSKKLTLAEQRLKEEFGTPYDELTEEEKEEKEKERKEYFKYIADRARVVVEYQRQQALLESGDKTKINVPSSNIDMSSRSVKSAGSKGSKGSKASSGGYIDIEELGIGKGVEALEKAKKSPKATVPISHSRKEISTKIESRKTEPPAKSRIKGYKQTKKEKSETVRKLGLTKGVSPFYTIKSSAKNPQSGLPVTSNLRGKSEGAEPSEYSTVGTSTRAGVKPLVGAHTFSEFGEESPASAEARRKHQQFLEEQQEKIERAQGYEQSRSATGKTRTQYAPVYTTETVEKPLLDYEGKPVLDLEGKPVKVKETVTKKEKAKRRDKIPTVKEGPKFAEVSRKLVNPKPMIEKPKKGKVEPKPLSMKTQAIPTVPKPKKAFKDTPTVKAIGKTFTTYKL